MAKNSRVSWAAASAALAVLTMVAIVFMAGWESEEDEHYQVVEEASPVRGVQWNPRMVLGRDITSASKNIDMLKKVLANAKKKLNSRISVIIDAMTLKNQGRPGVQGPQGKKGPQGYAGPPGAQGKRGSPGIVGPKGPRGHPGQKGYRGETGDIGEKGPQGYIGSPGGKGYIGPIGQRGPT
ncbi:hypothetical protein GUITHDRAFT_146404 [Guillardia theta CCMP2712]|uniref:Uncharacterized protein n=1 Tax=Guillardia theta (strain CCMP2712) TaxID=905079 RepID=L1II07_GUITC|nr:hypothetical protein GUITHDRAFT_146404 [Guillardia theta CCMP2712]EKX35579.1 hypothetical protein GUITHDRAFT_146404 [Guillardia theta CCMP2712]|eukprot:XP_005822559.1 hypothetical protein GUITHDRAFT_146404 [Guillardia theta CCMP2712]